MKHSNRWFIVVLLVVAVLLAACGGQAETTSGVEPAQVEPIAGTEFNRVVLTEKAMQRLGIETAPTREEQMEGATHLVVPYAAVIYGLNGETWVYVASGPRTYRREPISVSYIEGDTAVLSDGPPPGTQVVTVAVAELYGADTGVGK